MYMDDTRSFLPSISHSFLSSACDVVSLTFAFHCITSILFSGPEASVTFFCNSQVVQGQWLAEPSPVVIAVALFVDTVFALNLYK